MVSNLPEKILVIAPEGIGGAVLSLPGLQIFRQEHPDVKITVLAEPELEDFWRMVPSVNGFQCLKKNRPMFRELKREHFDRAYILREDFRAALIPWRAGIARRIGFRGHWRRLLLTEVIHRPEGHRQFEVMNILGVQGEPPAPELVVPHQRFQTLERKLIHLSLEQSKRGSANAGQRPKGEANIGKNRSVIFQALEAEHPLGARPVITLMPGGSEKRWPTAHFGLLAKNLTSSLKAVVLLVGDAADADVCAEVAAAADPDAVNLAGKTTFQEWAALLAVSNCVVSNESGGMHLAATLAPVIGLYGLTDPKKTGPLGKHIVFQKREPKEKNVRGDADAAAHALAMIGADEVFMAVKNLLASLR